MTTPSKAAVKIFIACEDKDAFLRARRVERQLETLCGRKIDIAPVFWNFALLRHAGLRECAAADAAEAEVIVVSIHNGGELPSHVKCWLESLPARRHGRGALVALAGSPEEPWSPPPPYIAYLRQIAANRGLDFFCNRNERKRRDVFQPGFSAFGGVPWWSLTPAGMGFGS